MYSMKVLVLPWRNSYVASGGYSLVLKASLAGSEQAPKVIDTDRVGGTVKGSRLKFYLGGILSRLTKEYR